MLADAADQRKGNQKAEEREAGDRLHHIGKAEDPTLKRSFSREENAHRERDTDGDRDGEQNQPEMLHRELNDFARQF